IARAHHGLLASKLAKKASTKHGAIQKERTEFEPSEIGGLLATARNAMIARGKAALGEKTVLDGLQAQVDALDACRNEDNLLDAAIRAAANTVETFQPLPNRAGRARIFAEKSVGLPDPGQLALVTMTEGLR
ncbi:DAK2 domain-containing protein, partial [Falsirhodobacter sp. 20TX0035]|uniref:DAK2 domain-containing protein n=1 Tax=Falsirhodobacter sp. 20TX0035 TaxID=3022019 RepID=UPI00232A82DB